MNPTRDFLITDYINIPDPKLGTGKHTLLGAVSTPVLF